MVKLKTFENSKIVKDWESLLKLKREEVENIEASWEEVMKFNKEVFKTLMEERDKKIKDTCEYFKNLGIEIYKYKKNSFFKEKDGYLKWFDTNVIKEIKKKYPYFLPEKPVVESHVEEVDGIKLSNSNYNISLLKLYDMLQLQYKNGKSRKESKNKLLIESIKYATLNNIDIENLDEKSIIYIVREHAVSVYEKENLPDGTEVYLKHGCDYCNTYIVGSHRCECGNRRVYIEIEGDIIKGFYHYPEVY